MVTHQTNRTFICSTVFVDLVEYSRKSVSEQLALKDRFTALLARAGTFSDPGLRAYELYGLDPRGERRRRRLYAAAAVIMAVALVGAGIGVRVAKDGRQAFMDSIAAKTQSYWSAVVRKVKN